MRMATFEALRPEPSELAAQINREISRRLARSSGGLLGQLGMLARLGV